MPTIDELAPATAAADTDQLVVSQAGLTRRLSRAQVVAGLQPELSIPSGRLIGRSSTGSGPVETISLGANLTLTNGTLAAASTPFVVSQLPNGLVPSTTDLIPILQGGTTVAVTYSQFQNSLGRVNNVDVSQAMVTPTGGAASRRLADIAQTMLSTSGGTMTGALTLSGLPAAGGDAATKDYVDATAAAALPRSGGTLSGALTLSGNPSLASHAATKAYVDGQVGTALPRSGGTLAGALTLNGDPVAGNQAATKQYVDTRVARGGDTLTGPLTLAGAPTSALHAATKSYVDIQVQSALPLTGGTLSGSLILAGDPSLAHQAATKSYVDAHSGTGLTPSGGTMTGVLVLAADPVSAFQAVTKQYVDAKISRSGDTLTGPLVLAGDPTTGPQAATKSYVDSVATASGALLRSGGTLTGPLTLSGDPTTTTQAATKRYVDAQVATALPQSGGTVSGALTLSTAPTAAGHAATKQYVDAQVATAVPVSGGTVGGPLNLSATPTAPLHAVPKQYVDGIVGTYGLNLKLAPYGAPLNGSADDTPAFKAAYAAASSNAVIHVPNGTAVLQDCSAWGVSLSKPVKWVLDGTVRADGTALASAVPTGTNPAPTNLPGVVQGHSSSGVEFSRSNSSSTDLAVLHSSYVVGHAGGSNAVIANARTDTLIYNSPSNFVWAGLDRLIWTGIQAPTRTTLVQHVGRYVQTIRQTTTTDSNGAPLPQPELWAACLEYRDVTNKPSSAAAAAITVEMDWVGNGVDDAGNR
ncbi:MAG: hypothetical protein J0H19_02420 [Rhodospirillales bacterium]|nr:hypothetical protein [Rhodospirillales bacterium]